MVYCHLSWLLAKGHIPQYTSAAYNARGEAKIPFSMEIAKFEKIGGWELHRCMLWGMFDPL